MILRFYLKQLNLALFILFVHSLNMLYHNKEEIHCKIELII